MQCIARSDAWGRSGAFGDRVLPVDDKVVLWGDLVWKREGIVRYRGCWRPDAIRWHQRKLEDGLHGSCRVSTVTLRIVEVFAGVTSVLRRIVKLQVVQWAQRRAAQESRKQIWRHSKNLTA